MYFRNRRAAGKQLAEALSAYQNQANLLVLALPRGGVPVAYEVAQVLHAPLDLLLVRKLGVPGQEEVAFGAIANGNILVFNEDLVRRLALPGRIIEKILSQERRELERRDKTYRQGNPPPNLKNKIIILVDDGCATGANMRAAVLAARKQGAMKIIVAVPVIADSAYALLKGIADQVVYLTMPEPFYGVGGSYHDFTQTSDDEVKTLLKQKGVEA